MPIGIAIGIVLGLVGAGGALLATPLLLTVGGFSFAAASTGALFVVFFASIAALLVRDRAGLSYKRAGLAIALGTVGSVPGSFLAQRISDQTAAYLLIGVLALAAVVTWNSDRAHTDENHKPHIFISMALFVFVGFLTGLTGVGGGFVLIPGLVVLLRVPFNKAVALSLLVVSGNSLISIATRFIEGVNLVSSQWVTVAIVVSTAVVGSLIGAKLSTRLNRKIVQRSFSVLAIILCAVIFVTHLSDVKPAQASQFSKIHVSATLKEGTYLATIIAPRLGATWSKKVYEGTSISRVLTPKGLGHYSMTQMPGEVGNFAVAGHRAGSGGPFRNIDKFKNGDLVYVLTSSKKFTYRYLQTKIVKPSSVEVLLPRPGGMTVTTHAQSFLTLQTCTPIHVNTKRLIVWFELIEIGDR